MSSLNLCVLIGNLTKDPELRYTPKGTAVAKFRIAVNSKFGETKKVLFMPVEVWGKTAEACGQYLKKGSSALVQGRIEENAWKDNDGNERKRMLLVAEKVQFMGGGNGQEHSSGDSPADDFVPDENTDLEPF